MNKFIVAPSLLSADFSNLEFEIKNLMETGTHWIHLDVMDAHFVPNLTLGPPVVKSLRKIKEIYLDCHLMIEEPEKYISHFIKAGVDNITLHVESKGDMEQMITRIKQKGVGVGITLRPSTPLVKIKPYLNQVDLVLVMTVEPGFGGQTFMENQVVKVNELAEMKEKNNFKYQIQVDGGINKETKKRLTRADVLVAGNFIFKHPEGYKKAIMELENKEFYD